MLLGNPGIALTPQLESESGRARLKMPPGFMRPGTGIEFMSFVDCGQETA